MGAAAACLLASPPQMRPSPCLMPAVHDQMGVMHSDICARNVLLSRDCRAYLGDLGLGLELAAGVARTAVGGSTLHAGGWPGGGGAQAGCCLPQLPEV